MREVLLCVGRSTTGGIKGAVKFVGTTRNTWDLATMQAVPTCFHRLLRNVVTIAATCFYAMLMTKQSLEIERKPGNEVAGVYGLVKLLEVLNRCYPAPLARL